MTPEKVETRLLTDMAKNVAEMQQYLEKLGLLLDEPEIARASADDLNRLLTPSTREATLKAAILEAIDELEESRKSFKSKRLEKLRKRLTQALLDSR